MFDAYVEGVGSLDQVCQLVILAPVALTIVAARGRWAAVIGGIGGVVLGGWLFVSDSLGAITDAELRITATLLIVVVVLLAGVGLSRRDRPGWIRPVGRMVESAPGTAALSALVGVMVTQWWRPCVGVELGAILTGAPDDPWRWLLPTVGFMLGVSMPLVALGLVYAVWRPPARAASTGAWIGCSLASVLALSVIAGHHGEIVARLFEWSQ